jgi:hypothetical protein
LFTVSNNKVPRFTHLGCFKVALHMGELLKSAQHFLERDFLLFFCNSDDLGKFNKFANFHPIYSKNKQKNLTYLRGQKNLPSCCCLLGKILSFVGLSIHLSLKVIFLVF